MPQLFVGTWPPPEVEAVLAEYPRTEITGLRWATPSQWLVNMRPLGDVIDGRVGPLVDALRAELDGAPKVTATFGRVYRVGWLTAEVDGLEDLTTTVFEATTPIVPVALNDAWHASIVIARGRMPKEMVLPLPPTPWTVDELVLARTRRSKAGPGYETVEAFPLG